LAALVLGLSLVGVVAPGASDAAPLPGDLPDPSVVWTGARYVAYGTNSGTDTIPTRWSDDLVTWTEGPDALPELPVWASPGRTWAPAISFGGLRWLLYYSVLETATHRQCISVAVSATAEGPFVDASTGPLVCQREHGGSIDPSVFVDADGSRTLLWKSEGFTGSEASRLWSQPLAPDGLHLLGTPVVLLTTNPGWEDPIIENPTMVRDGDRYDLFYSGNSWWTAGYAIGWAVCESAAGPCVRPVAKPWLASQPGAVGPGAPSVFRDRDGQPWLAFHAWAGDRVGYPASGRDLRVTRLSFQHGWPVAAGSALPSRTTAPEDVVMGFAPDVHDDGYRFVTRRGSLLVQGGAASFGSAAAVEGANWIVAMAASPSGDGYWQVATDGGVFSFGEAQFHGSTGDLVLNRPIVGMAATASGEGYWLVASDGGVFAFGDAGFFGSTGGLRLNEPIVGMAATPSGQGYWLVAADGGVFAFGDATFEGSTGRVAPLYPVVAVAPTASGDGYWTVGSDGSVHAFGDAPWLGELGPDDTGLPVVGIAGTRTGDGYWVVAADGTVFAFGDAPDLGSVRLG
jgi:hypothetical protein